MTEADIVTQYNLFTDRVIVILQWWASVSFALIAIAHFSAKKLNLVLVLTLSILYVLLSIFVVGTLGRNLSLQVGLQEDLAAIQAIGELSHFGETMMSELSPLAGLSLLIGMLGLFIGALFYLFFSYRSARVRG